jgi:hypothetical protein
MVMTDCWYCQSTQLTEMRVDPEALLARYERTLVEIVKGIAVIDSGDIVPVMRLWSRVSALIAHIKAIHLH